MADDVHPSDERKQNIEMYGKLSQTQRKPMIMLWSR